MTEDEMRKFCSQHCYISDIARKAVPRWAFISTLSAMLIIATVVSGWYSMSLNNMHEKINTDHMTFEKNLRDKYTQDVERFINAVRENRQTLREIKDNITQVKIKQGQIAVKQDLVIQKIGLDRGPGG